MRFSRRPGAQDTAGHGPDVGGRVGGVADGQGVLAGDEEFGEALGDVGVDDEALRADATLAGVVVARADSYCPRAPSDAGDR